MRELVAGEPVASGERAVEHVKRRGSLAAASAATSGLRSAGGSSCVW